jgi:hypothetical protein
MDEEERTKMLQELFSQLDITGQGDKSPDKPEEQVVEEIPSSLSKSRMDDNETNRLRELGETLEQAQDVLINEPNDDPNIGTSVESEPNSDPNLTEPNI